MVVLEAEEEEGNSPSEMFPVLSSSTLPPNVRSQRHTIIMTQCPIDSASPNAFWNAYPIIPIFQQQTPPPSLHD